MCRRFQLSVKGKQISERFDIEVFDELYKSNYNCTPSQRLSVILKPEDEQSLLMENDTVLLNKLLAPYRSHSMGAYSISKKVNSPKNNNSEIIISQNGGNPILFYPEE